MNLSIGNLRVPDLDKVLEEATEEVPEGLGAAAVELTRESWPVDTGASRDGFYYEARGRTALLWNREDYAGIINARRGGIVEGIIDDGGSREKEFLEAGQNAVNVKQSGVGSILRRLF